MPGRLLGFRRASPAPSVDPSAPKRDSFHSQISASGRRRSTSLARKQKSKPNPKVDVLALAFGRRYSQDAKMTNKSPPAVQEPGGPAKLDMLVESPPLVLFNQPQDSTGALFSGLLKIDVRTERVVVESFSARFVQKITTKKPVGERCSQCANHTKDLKTWDFLAEPVHGTSSLTLDRGEHKVPLSYLLDGKLPATTRGIDMVLDYHIIAEAVLNTGDVLSYTRTIDVKRAIIPGIDKHSVRIFPPTNLTCQVTLPPVVYPIGEFKIAMRMAGTTNRKADCILSWRLQRLLWRIEETQKTVSPACQKHQHKLATQEDGTPSDGQPHVHTRDIGDGELKTGWKTCIDDNIEIEIPCHVNSATRPVCNMSGPHGMSVKHQLIVEMVVAEQWSSKKKPQQTTPTGSARILRTQFGLVLTERSGMGIAWDDEAPPVYDDVPASPPTYRVATAEDISDIEATTSFESLRLSE
ncbi:hypothetical protein EJ05DRAFT_506500 [Pseudovirgaria hyperparasitica]|uniref:LDB19 N-terminal domain-containing protein n=1 Tax=Pseudovirgaria hyperparasitica TaxID=470096 RepID=A0A6A6WKX5_9PEZI|nr:uncharacterized protein EJ05DRAFT_506500 [Pseudovirgaria hyperparasitica]KAF2762826.1 hypothetical protein EJ05DRAFT_506500 [Pseudovirgaria hyperparasitica]